MAPVKGLRSCHSHRNAMSASDALSSSHAFVKALRSPTQKDKIHLAQRAWESESLYIPGKAELIVDWLWNEMLKSKDALSKLLKGVRFITSTQGASGYSLLDFAVRNR